MSFTRNDLKTATGTASTVTAASTASANSGELCCLTGWVWDNGASTTLPATFSDGTDTYTLVTNSHQQMLTNFHTFEYYAVLSRNVTTYAPSFTLGTPGTSREWRVAFTHYTPDSTPSPDVGAGQVQSASSTSTDSTSTATTTATTELVHAAMISDAASTNIGVTDPDTSAVPAGSNWLVGGLYRIQNNSANQAGSTDEYNGTLAHSVAARYHSGQTTSGHQAAMVATYKTSGAAAFDPASVPWPGQLPDPVQVQLVEF